MERLKNPFTIGEDVGHNETIDTPSEDFLAFSSTSTPAKGYSDNASFKPKRGKHNRMGNWERFGNLNMEQQSPYQSQNSWNQGRGFRGNANFIGSPNNISARQIHNNSNLHESPNQRFQHGPDSFRRGTPRSEPGPRGGTYYRGAPGFFGTPQAGSYNRFQNSRGRYNSGRKEFGPSSFRGDRPRWRGNDMQKYSYTSSSASIENGYFHPSMLENPWAHLEKYEQSCNSGNANISSPSIETLQNVTLSDSMIPQVGDTVLERNEDLHKNKLLEKVTGSQELFEESRYSDTSSDEDNVIITIGETPHILDANTKNISKSHFQAHKNRNEMEDSLVSKSDSMIPLVGDSILAHDVTID